MRRWGGPNQDRCSRCGKRFCLCFLGGVPKYNAQEGGFPNQNRCIRRGKRFCLCFGGGSPKYNAREGGFPNQNRVQSPRHIVLLFWGAPPHHIVDSDYVEGL